MTTKMQHRQNIDDAMMITIVFHSGNPSSFGLGTTIGDCRGVGGDDTGGLGGDTWTNGGGGGQSGDV